MRVLCYLALVAAAAASAVEMTKENFKDQTDGKNAFVKFLAPW